MRYFIFLCGLLYALTTTGQNSFDAFYPGTYAQLRQEAKAKNQGYYLYFYVKGSNAAQQMRLMTFTPNLIDQTGGSFLKPLPVQAFSIYGDYIIKKYDIETFPQILVFTAEDKLLDRIEGVVPEAELLRRLNAHAGKKGAANSIDVFLKDLDPRLIDRLQLDSKLEAIYKFKVDDGTPEESNAVGIQLGVFKDFNHIVRAVFELGLEDHDNVLVSLHRTEERTFLRLVLGPFASVAEGKAYEEKLRVEKGLYGYLIDLSDFRPLEPIPTAGETESPFTPFEEEPTAPQGGN